jgi:hypothetical protein
MAIAISTTGEPSPRGKKLSKSRKKLEKKLAFQLRKFSTSTSDLNESLVHQLLI